MRMLQKMCFVLLLTTFSSVYGWDCFKDKDVDDCRMKAEQGNAEAQSNLGGMYFNGQGVSQDYKEAVKWDRLAAQQGYVDAQYHLGVMYAKGIGVPQDYKESLKWYMLAAEQDNAEAQYQLGVIYAQGQGVPQNYVMAHMYFNIALVSGDKDSVRSRDEVAMKMTSSQIERAEDLAMKWEISQGKLEYHEDRGEETLIEKAEDLAMEWEITQGKLEYYEDRGGKTLIITVVTIILLFYFYRIYKKRNLERDCQEQEQLRQKREREKEQVHREKERQERVRKEREEKVRREKEKQEREEKSRRDKERQEQEQSRKKREKPKDRNEKSRSYEEILGLSSGWTKSDLKSAYRKKCQQIHPDKWKDFPEDIAQRLEKEYKEVQKAYKYLSKK